MDALLRRLSRAGVRRVMAGEHWAWLVIALTAVVLRRARHTYADEVITIGRDEVLYVGEGAALQVTEP